MSKSKNISHKEASERAYISAAHREDRTDEARQESLEKAKALHKQRVGTPLHEDLEPKGDKVEQPGLADTEEGRKERAYIAAAHREGRDDDKKIESLQKASDLHEERTGEPLQEAIEKGIAEATEDKKELDEREQHLLNQERAFIAAAHRKGRDAEGKNESLAKASEIHEELTGEPLPEAVDKGISSDPKEAKEATHLENQERAFIAAAHRKGRDAEGKLESLVKASEIHEERTGEPLPEAVEKGLVDEDGVLNENGKRAHAKSEEEEHEDKRQKVEQPGLSETASGRQERAFIAAAHRDGRSEEGKLDSLKKANEIHEKRTGEPLSEAVERGVAAM